jgi:hypothetical protein
MLQASGLCWDLFWQMVRLTIFLEHVRIWYSNHRTAVFGAKTNTIVEITEFSSRLNQLVIV